MRLIDSDALKCELFKLMDRTLESEDRLDDVIPLIDNAPTICEMYGDIPEFHEQKQGEWIVNIPDGWHCSICGCVEESFIRPAYKFCPNCGAQMFGGENE